MHSLKHSPSKLIELTKKAVQKKSTAKHDSGSVKIEQFLAQSPFVIFVIVFTRRPELKKFSFCRYITPTEFANLFSLPCKWSFNRKGSLLLPSSLQVNTERGCLSVARFCYSFLSELRGPARVVGTYSIGHSAGGTSQNMICKTLRQIDSPTL